MNIKEEAKADVHCPFLSPGEAELLRALTGSH